jgi:RHS repeat-associated protein
MLTVVHAACRRAGYGVTVALVANLAVAGLAGPVEAFTGRDDLPVDEPVEVIPVVRGGTGFVDPSADQLWDPAEVADRLPEPATARFDLDPAVAQTAAPAGFPVSVTAPGYRPGVPRLATSGTVTVTVLDAGAARAAGVAGLLVRVSGPGAGAADLRVDYAGFSDLFGGGWGSRLRLLELPACSVTTPRVEGCLQSTPVQSVNMADRQTLTARLDLDPTSAGVAGGRVFAVTASASGEGGDYRATDLSPAGSWTAGGNDGAFTYGFPLRLPPAAGPVPEVTLGYSSAGHDGRTSGSNNQASWIGDGWGYQPGFIERSYRPCSLDEDGSNNPDLTGDLCWDGDGESVTMSLNGSNTTLVRDGTSGNWRAERDSNWRIELLGSPASSGGGTSERWKVTTPDGTQYWFGTEAATSDSRWTVPVFGNHPGEPCRASGFAGSSCRQAYRWMVDKVVDVHGNLVRYFYAIETGHYGAAGDPDNRVAFDRAGRLTQVDYGLREDQGGVPATGRVRFTAEDRCLSGCGTTGDPVEENWPDTPWDLECDAAPCTSQLSPAFFSAKRLATITTEVRDGGTFRQVDSWEFTHEFKDYGDEEQVTLWLKSIQQTGHVGGDTSLPAVVFGGEALPNRVDAAAGVPVMWRWRMSSIKTEAGAVITVDYAPVQCGPGNLPADKHANSMRCFPVRWTPEFFTEPVEDWFHKHVVSSVVETDPTGGGVAVETYYEYSTAGGGTPVLWAFDDSEFTEDEHRSYNEWRGYPQVTTRLGDPAQPQTRTRARFYRGLDGQPLPGGGTRDVAVVGEEGETAADHEALAGQRWESLTYNGLSVIEGSTYQYWTRKTATQAREHDGGDLTAWLAGVSVEQTHTWLAGSTWQRTETRTSYDLQGRVTEVDRLGDVGESGDEQCTRTEYTENPTAWIKDTVKRLETVAVDCGTSPSRPADVVSDTRTFFDGSGTHGAIPSKGMLTRTDVLDSWDGGPAYVTTARMAYDPLGRLVSTTDALNRTTTTAYTPPGAGPATRTMETNPAGHQTTTDLEPAWGLPVAMTGPNGRRTGLAYDPLGRAAAVWLPGRHQASQSASLRFDYQVRDDGPSAVTTHTLNHQQQYVVSIELFDALLRPRQTQTETADGGRLVTETIYDSHGRVDEEFGPNHHLSPPDPSAIVRVREEDSARRIGYFYDAAGRLTDEVFYNKHVERWRTVTSYGGSTDGSLVTVQPPAGAPAVATVTDARGNVTARRTYHTNAPIGSYDALTYQHTPTGQIARMTDPAGNQWSWEYDLRDRLVAAHDPDAGTTTLAYDPAGQVLTSTDARGETVVNSYDSLGRPLTRRDGDGTLLAEWEYDTAIGGVGMPGKSTRWVDGNAYVHEVRAVNPQGNISQTRITLPAAEGPLAGSYWFTRGYYPNGQLGSLGYGDAGDVEGGGLVHHYDRVGNPTRLIFHGDYTGTTVVVDQATFTPFGEVQSRRFGAGNTRHAYQNFVYEEGTRRLERATFDRDATLHAVADLRYTYDDAGNLTAIADVPEDLSANHELQCFQYDQQRRLVEAWAQDDTSGCEATPSLGVLGGPAPYWHSYQHDVTGNRTGETLRAPGGPTQQRSYTYPAAGQPQPHALQQVTGTGAQLGYGYDQAGNATSRTVDGQVQTLYWDAEGNLDEVEQDGQDTLRMVYDAGGNRLIRDDGDTVTAYLPETELSWHRDTGELDGTRYFSHAGTVVAACTGQDVADWTWLGVDQHGTTTSHAVNAFTAVEKVRRMDPYGNPRGPQPAGWPGQQGFVGGVPDPTGLVHIGVRSYDPTTGRFISVDAILNLDDGQQINGYAYAHNNPITFTDPTGLFSCIDGDCSYHNPDGSTKTPDECRAAGGCGRGFGSSFGSTASAAVENEARDEFFGPPPDGHVRQVFETGAIAPGNGVIIARFFIRDDGFYFNFGKGDGRDFSDDIEAGYRVVIAWDTETGRVSITAAPSCVAVGCLSPSAIGEGNNLEIQEADGGDLAFEFSAKSSARVLPAIDQTVRLHISGDGSTGVRLRGDGYPDFEAIAYRGNDAEFLASTVRGTPGGPLVQLAPPLPDRDLAWIDGNLRFQDGRPTWNDRIGPAMRQLCLVNPIAPGC